MSCVSHTHTLLHTSNSWRTAAWPPPAAATLCDAPQSTVYPRGQSSFSSLGLALTGRNALNSDAINDGFFVFILREACTPLASSDSTQRRQARSPHQLEPAAHAAQTDCRQTLQAFKADLSDLPKVRAAALQWALLHGSRSGRAAHQFARDYAGQQALEQQQ